MQTWSPEQWLILITGVLTALTVMTVKVVGALKGVETKVDALEIKVDGRLSRLLEMTEQAKMAEGREAGRAEMIVQVPLPLPVVVVPPGEGA